MAFAKRLPVWRALTAVLYRAHGAGRKARGKAAEGGVRGLGIAAGTEAARTNGAVEGDGHLPARNDPEMAN